jgi:hypothetical protein
MHWAKRFSEQHGVAAGEHAPMSAKKRTVIDENRSEGLSIIAGLAAAVAEVSDKKDLPRSHQWQKSEMIAFRTRDVRLWLAGRKAALACSTYGDDGMRLLESPELISTTLKGAGLKVSKHQIKIGGKLSRIAANFPVKDAKAADVEPFLVVTGADFDQLYPKEDRM